MNPLQSDLFWRRTAMFPNLQIAKVMKKRLCQLKTDDCLVCVSRHKRETIKIGFPDFMGITIAAVVTAFPLGWELGVFVAYLMVGRDVGVLPLLTIPLATYIKLAYAGVTAAFENKGIFRRLAPVQDPGRTDDPSP